MLQLVFYMDDCNFLSFVPTWNVFGWWLCLELLPLSCLGSLALVGINIKWKKQVALKVFFVLNSSPNTGDALQVMDGLDVTLHLWALTAFRLPLLSFFCV